MLFGTLLNVVYSNPHRACTHLPANSRRADLETWAYLAPGIIPPQEHDPRHSDRNASCAPHDAISSTHVTEIEQLNPRSVQGVFLFSRILFLPRPEPLTQ